MNTHPEIRVPINPQTTVAVKAAQLLKLDACHGDMVVIRNFLEWLAEQGIVLAEEHKQSGELLQTCKSSERLLYSYFEIDAAELDNERRALLDAQRALNEGTVAP